MAKEANAQSTDNGYRLRTTLIEDTSEAVNPTPGVESISPSSANIGSGPHTVTITGSGFVPESVARFNGSERNTTFIDSAHLLVYLTSSDMNGSAGRYINVYNPEPAGGYSNSAFFKINGYVAPAPAKSTKTTNSAGYTPAKSSNTNNNSNNSGSVQGAQDSNTSNTDNYSSLASNAIYGTNSFMPSGLVQWLLFAIFVLIVVIILRKIFFADKYHNTPLKHA